MELGIGMFGDLHIDKNGEVQPTGQRLRELIEEIKLMDEVGLDFYGIGEHHRPRRCHHTNRSHRKATFARH